MPRRLRNDRVRLSIATRTVHEAIQRQPFAVTTEIVEYRHGGSVWLSHAGDMRCQHNSRVTPERVTCRQRLNAAHIEHRCRKLALVQCLQEVGLDQMIAASEINQSGTRW